MDVLAFDGRMGAAGDMILGALLAAGADPAVLSPVEDGVGVTYAVDEVTKHGVRATAVDVVVGGDRLAGSEGDDEHAHREDSRADQESHGHRDDDARGGPDGHDHAEGAGPSRTYPEVVAVVEGMGLPGSVEAEALAVFERLGEAEAAVHGTDLAETHFHEVGADDAIADVVGAALLFADLEPDRVVTTPLSTGEGEVVTSHGRYPVPTPAVVEIAEGADWSIRGGPVGAELLTPTGAAILAEVADGIEALPALRVRASGYGAGDRDFPDHPNVLRAIRGDGGDALRRDDIRVLETNVDDVTPEVLGSLQESLADAGARDVTILPATMKKARPGHVVKVVAKPGDARAVARRLAAETGTLGIRETGATHRWIAEREVRTVTLDLDGGSHEVGVKVAADASGVVFDVSAEYDDAAAVARETDRPVREVMRLAEEAYRGR